MEQTPICSIHKTPMVWKTGVSKKTNNSYAFWGCDQKSSDGSFCKGKPVVAGGGDTNFKPQNAPGQQNFTETTQTSTQGSNAPLNSILSELRAIRELLSSWEEKFINRELGVSNEQEIPIID